MRAVHQTLESECLSFLLRWCYRATLLASQGGTALKVFALPVFDFGLSSKTHVAASCCLTWIAIRKE